jgi:hypothetical protein
MHRYVVFNQDVWKPDTTETIEFHTDGFEFWYCIT